MDDTWTPMQPLSASARCARDLWRAHAGLVLLVGGYTVWSTVDSTPDANMGLGLGLLTTAALGAPWSLPVLQGLPDGWGAVDSWLFAWVAASTAILNLVLHGLVARWWIVRTTSRSRRMEG